MVVGETQQNCCHQRGASARPTGQGGTGASLPDTDLQAIAAVHPQEMHVRLGREEGVHLKGGAPGIKGNGVEVIDGHHDMGIAHADCRYRKARIGQIGFTTGQAIDQRQRGGNRRRLQKGRPHVHQQLTIDLQFRTNQTRRRLNRPAAPRRVTVTVREKTGQATDAVAAHLRLTAIGIEDAHAQITICLGWQGQDHAITAYTKAAITDLPNPGWIGVGDRQWQLALTSFKNQKVVAKPLIFAECQHSRKP